MGGDLDDGSELEQAVRKTKRPQTTSLNTGTGCKPVATITDLRTETMAGRRISRVAFGALVALGALGSTTLVFANELKAVTHVSANGISFDAKGSYSNITLTVSGPNGFHNQIYSETAIPSLSLAKLGIIDDGRYRYELTAASKSTVINRSKLDNGRGKNAQDTAYQPVAINGAFHVKAGRIIQDKGETEN